MIKNRKGTDFIHNIFIQLTKKVHVVPLNPFCFHSSTLPHFIQSHHPLQTHVLARSLRCCALSLSCQMSRFPGLLFSSRVGLDGEPASEPSPTTNILTEESVRRHLTISLLNGFSNNRSICKDVKISNTGTNSTDMEWLYKSKTDVMCVKSGLLVKLQADEFTE